PEAPLHRRPAVGRAHPRPAEGTAAPAHHPQGRRPVARQPASRVPLPHPLLEGSGGVPHRRPAPGREGTRPLGRVPLPGGPRGAVTPPAWGRGRLVAAAVLVIALIAPACSPKSVPRAAAPDGILRVGLERPQTLDPAPARFPADLPVVDQPFDGPTTYDASTLQALPALASRWEGAPGQ